MRFSIIIPTFNHQDTINYAIKSVLQQTLQDFEIIVVGDGCPETTDEIMNYWMKHDTRIQYQSNPKGLGHGELFRHEAIQKSNGEYIFYLGDDDMWLPRHLEILSPFLKTFDFVHSTHCAIHPGNEIYHLEDQIAKQSVRQRMSSEKWNFFGPTCAAHTKEAYQRLPYGWRPRPDGMWSDLYMWRQWFSQKDMRFFSIPYTTTVHFPSPLRGQMTLGDRIQELESYWPKVSDDEFIDELQKMRVQQSSLFNENSEPFIEGLLNVILTSQEELGYSIENIEKEKLKATYWKHAFDALQKAHSTRLGFMLTWPLRMVYELLRR